MSYKLLLYFLLISIASCMLSVACFAQDGREIFNRDCNSCHTIGAGIKVGPDLQGITKTRNQDWLAKFINNSAQLIASGDKDAKEIFEKFHNIPMPPHTLSTSEIKALLNYIDNPANYGRAQSTEHRAPLITPNPKTGENYFTGKIHLKNGGASCISCHSIRYEAIFSGGSFAKDLSASYSQNILDSMVIASAAMRFSYIKHELTFTEKTHIEAFLKNVYEEHYYSHPKHYSSMLILWGTFFSIIILLLYRFSKSMRFGKSIQHTNEPMNQ